MYQKSLSQDEALRYEELSKGYFEDFYAGSTPSTCQSSLDFEGRCYSESSLPSCSNPVSPLLPQQQQKSSVDLTTPTDAELDALFNDMLHKDSSLEHSLGFAQHPLMHNVSLGVPLTQSNLTEGMPHMNFGCESQCGVPTVGVVPATPSIPSAAFNGSHFWNNHTEGPLPPYLRTDGINNLTMAVQQMCHSEPVLAEIGAVSTYPANPLHNVASLQVPYIPNNGALYDNFGSRRSLSISNESSIDSSSTSSSTSPRYNSEAENHSPNQSRFYGKLIPNPIEEHEKFYEKNRLSMSCSVLPRRRGRQSKDEQLAMSYRLPASAALISDMSLPELQKMLRSEDLSEDQKALIRKIRRRGKNKVAARTCRQRRGETKGMPPSPQPNAHLATWNEPSRTLYRRQ
ncbi:unnamed protein product, partial [Mesorhabditis belari]|uniref:BZIP domain-containing protein n=1 Tax=Mesorhabditis belari TaxID=2138241 RepID=A0AAF3EYW6_9BILA